MTGPNGLFTLVKKILKDLSSIKELGVSADEDPQYDLLDCLKKIESQLNYLSEARDHLARPDPNTLAPSKIGPYEVTHRRVRREERMRHEAEEREAQLEARKKEQAEEAERLKHLEIFRGRRDQYRSQKKQFKPKKQKVEKLDPETKDQKEYLDPVIFAGLQDYLKQQELEDPERFEKSGQEDAAEDLPR